MTLQWSVFDGDGFWGTATGENEAQVIFNLTEVIKIGLTDLDPVTLRVVPIETSQELQSDSFRA